MLFYTSRQNKFQRIGIIISLIIRKSIPRTRYSPELLFRVYNERANAREPSLHAHTLTHARESNRPTMHILASTHVGRSNNRRRRLAFVYRWTVYMRQKVHVSIVASRTQVTAKSSSRNIYNCVVDFRKEDAEQWPSHAGIFFMYIYVYERVTTVRGR